MEQNTKNLPPLFAQNTPEKPNSSLREIVKQSAQDFKTSWRNLAKALTEVWQEKSYLKWGFDSFDSYAFKEIKIKKATAVKLINSYTFLQKEFPGLAETPRSDKKEIPSLELIQTLKKAKKNLDDLDYQNIKESAVAEEKDPKEIKRDITSLMRERKQLDPEVERKKMDEINIKRFISKLKDFKRDIEILRFLPESISEKIEELIEEIENSAF